MTWSQAQSHCRTNYMDLASVRTSAENSKLLAVKPSGESYWLGLYRDTWKWSNGDGSYWTSGQPAGSTEHCTTAYFNDTGRWRDWFCSYAKPFICHYAPETRFLNVWVPAEQRLSVLKALICQVRNWKPAATDWKPVETGGWRKFFSTSLVHQLQQKLKDQGVTAEISLRWMKQLDGNIFYQEKQDGQN